MPVSCDFFDIMEDAMMKKKDGKIFYFNEADEVEELEGFSETWENTKDGEFLITSKNEKVRLDKIITLYGNPGPAFEKYDGFANACLSCNVQA
jgi:hypothetical protein